LNQAIRKKLVDDGAWKLERGSIRMAVAGVRNREKFAVAFVDTMVAEGDIEDFRARCVEFGISPMLIMLLLSVAWDILFYWWTHREAEQL
jgi:hypothetical protein